MNKFEVFKVDEDICMDEENESDEEKCILKVFYLSLKICLHKRLYV